MCWYRGNTIIPYTETVHQKRNGGYSTLFIMRKYTQSLHNNLCIWGIKIKIIRKEDLGCT